LTIPHVFLLLFFMAPFGSQNSGQHASASGNLTVTAIVTSSVSVTFAPDGTPIIVVANAPADAAAIAQISSSSVSEGKSSSLCTNKKKASEKSTHKHKGVLHASTR